MSRRIVGLDSTPLLERLIADGVIARPKVAQRPRVSGTKRPRPRRPVSDYVSEQRR